MCMDCWAKQSGLTEVLCASCVQERDKEELRLLKHLAEAGDEDAGRLLKKKEEEEEKDKTKMAAAPEDAEQEHWG